MSTLDLEGRIELRSMSDWTRWKESHPEHGVTLRAVAEQVRSEGFVDPYRGRVRPEDVAATDVLREGIRAFGLCSRQRAVLRALDQRGARRDSRIYGTEAVTALALLLRGRFPYYLGSEYASTRVARERMYPIPHQDLTSLDLPEATFDFAMTNEVLEHVPDIDAALASLARILKPGGLHVGTVPFRYEDQHGLVKARVVCGRVQHLMQPEYHGNPFAEGGSLVFELPGWDILERARAAGFSDALMEFTWCADYGILAEELGVFLLTLRR